VSRANRPNTWLLRPILRREDSSCQPGAVHTWPFATYCSATYPRSLTGRSGIDRPTSMRRATLLTQKRHHPDEARAAGRSAIPCYPAPIDFIEEARPFPRRVLRSPSGGPSTSSGPCAIFKRSGLAVGCPRVAQMYGPAGIGRRIARYIVSGWALIWL
jgi:hypothetical protein